MSEHTIDPYQLAIKKPPKYEAPRTLDLKAGQEPRGKKIKKAIRFFKKNLIRIRDTKGRDKYNELLGISLYIFAMAPEKKQSSKIELSRDIEKKLKADGLDRVANYIKKYGGLDLGRYREKHKILGRIFKMAGLKKELLAEHYFNLGYAYAQKRAFDQAIREYTKATQINPDFAEAHSNLGDIYVQIDEPYKAIKAYKKATQINPNDAKAHYNLGVVYEKIGKPDLAIAEYKKVIQINPNDADVHSNLGNIYLTQGKVDGAIVEYLEALKINPNDANTHSNLGSAYVLKGEPGPAIVECKKALKINPDFADAHFNLGSAYVRKGEPDRAIAEYLEALKINPNDAGAHYNLGLAYAQIGKKLEEKDNAQQALEMYKKAQEKFQRASKLGMAKPKEILIKKILIELQIMIERLKGKLTK